MSKTYLSGVAGAGKAHYLFKRISEILENENLVSNLRVFAFVKDDELGSFYNDLRSFFNFAQFFTQILTFPSDDMQQRVFVIDKIKGLKNFIVCATDVSICSPVLNPKDDACVIISKNQKYNFDDLERYFASFGYARTNFVENKLQFALRGGIIDIWPAANEAPVRVFFEYDAVESLRIFDPKTQLSNSFVDEIKILSVNSAKYRSTMKDYFQNNALLYFDYPTDESFDKCELIINEPLNVESRNQGYKSFDGFQGNINVFLNFIKNFIGSGAKIKIYCANNGERSRIIDIFDENSLSCENLEFLYGDLSRGFYLENEKIAYISSGEMLYKKKLISFPKVKGGRRLESIWEISTGDYVVQDKYGIGRYMGLKTISRTNGVSEYLCIEYKNNDKLYIPPEEIKTVKKYIGIEGVKPKLYSMDTLVWERAKSKVSKAVKEFAKELLKLYAQRSSIKKKSFSTQTVWEKELEEAFPYELTPDQLKTLEDIKSDFLKPYPVERLVCGDVGYGKTEIAVRAAFKAIQNGMQAAVLVPTTILAQQHYNTFCNRLSIFPTKVAVISRFQSKIKQEEIVQELKNGHIDVIIGTHRLLQEDINFKNLGLLIIDEEHRFGVKQKEKIKSIKKNIDILMLSATPIPRTLSLALSGFRDLSVIETPPFGRLPIETSVSIYDERIIKNIIEAELSRNGQVFYVYNEIETILSKAASIRKLMPAVKLEVIHGRMKTKDIEKTMRRFTNMEIDVLLATTIIESGLDIPSVNTIIIEEAENFGLSQLYQLRGRIGRDNIKAYCYLFYKDKILSQEALKRLEVIKELSELNSGFRLALKDLEIRGAGGILSASQHGFVRDIGYDMFVKILEQEGKKIRGNAFETQENKNATIDLQADALIPSTYIEDEDIRVLFYRKFSNAKDLKTVENIKNELCDRFGKIPNETQTLFEIIGLKIMAEKLNIERISEDKDCICLYFSKRANLSKMSITELVNDYSSSIEFVSGKYYAFKLKKTAVDTNSIEYLKRFLSQLRFYIYEQSCNVRL